MLAATGKTARQPKDARHDLPRQALASGVVRRDRVRLDLGGALDSFSVGAVTSQRARLLGWLGLGLTLACIPLTALMLSQHLRAFLPAAAIWSTVVAFIGAVAFSLVGALIVSQHPRHAIGWIFALSGLATAGAVVLGAYAELALAPGWSLPAASFADSVAHVLIQSGIFLPLTLGLLLFPDGRLLSRVWGLAAAAAVLGLVVRLIADALVPPPHPFDFGRIRRLLTLALA